jgi:hypothetical protein
VGALETLLARADVAALAKAASHARIHRVGIRTRRLLAETDVVSLHLATSMGVRHFI